MLTRNLIVFMYIYAVDTPYFLPYSLPALSVIERCVEKHSMPCRIKGTYKQSIVNGLRYVEYCNSHIRIAQLVEQLAISYIRIAQSGQRWAISHICIAQSGQRWDISHICIAQSGQRWDNSHICIA
jgi:hypothetical protein